MKTSAKAYEAQYDKILALADTENTIDNEQSETKKRRGRKIRSKAQNLIDRLKLYKDLVLLIMRNPKVSFDNNQAERDIPHDKTIA